MFYLMLTIIGVIILVGLVIRRLPYLRTSRLGMEITSPRPYISKSSPFADVFYRIKTTFSGLLDSSKKITSLPALGVNLPRPSFHTPPPLPSFGGASTKVEDNDMAFIPDGMSATAHPGDFWQEHTPQSTGPLEIPEKGLITRRGESQKIAHELVTQADEAFRKKNYKDAEKYYLQAATKDPDNARIYNRLGVIYLQTKSFKDAVEAFKGALKFDDRVASRHYNLALAYLGKRDYRLAERCLKEAIKLEPINDKYRKTLEAIQKQVA